MASDIVVLKRKILKAAKKQGWEHRRSPGGKHTDQLVCPNCGRKLTLPDGAKASRTGVKNIEKRFRDHGLVL